MNFNQSATVSYRLLVYPIQIYNIDKTENDKNIDVRLFPTK